MAIRVIDKIKQKNSQAFKLLDYIDIEGRITGWQNPVSRIVADIASIPTTLADGELFILADASGLWPAFTGYDIYGNIAAAINNAIYQKQTSTEEGQPTIYYLVTGAVKNMITLDESATKLKVYNGTAWVDLVIPGGAVTGEVLRAELHLIVDTLSDPGANYSTSTHHLLTGEVMQTGDNVNIYVNGLKYTNTGTAPAVSFTVGESYLVWNTDNAGFDLTDGDEVEIEIFNVG